MRGSYGLRHQHQRRDQINLVQSFLKKKKKIAVVTEVKYEENKSDKYGDSYHFDYISIQLFT